MTVVESLDSAAALLEAERDENTCRLDMKPTEKVALGRALEELEAPRAAERRRAAQNNTSSENFTEQGERGETRDVVGAAVGMSGVTYQRAKAVVVAAEDETLPPEVRAEAIKAADERRFRPSRLATMVAADSLPAFGEEARRRQA